jgi:hypothetical protein
MKEKTPETKIIHLIQIDMFGLFYYLHWINIPSLPDTEVMTEDLSQSEAVLDPLP